MNVLRPAINIAALALAFCAAAHAQNYSVLQRWPVPGAVRWDYLTADPANHLLYVTHYDSVDAIDARTGKITGTISGLKGVHGVAFAPDAADAFISDGGANAVVVFDRKTFAIKQSIPAGQGPDGITYEPVSGTIWAFNGRSKTATVINANTKTVVATVPLPGRPEAAAPDGHGNLILNLEDVNKLARLDAKSHTVVAVWDLKDCDGPSGIAVDGRTSRAFSVCDGKKMVVTDTRDGRHIATVPIGDGPDAAAYDPDRKLVFSSNGDGTLTIVRQVSADEYQVVQNVATQKSARTMALDPGTGKIYLAAGEFGPRPAATADNPRPRPTPVPNSFVILVVGTKE